MSKPSRARYRTTNWSNYSSSLRKRASLLIWLDKDMSWFAPADGKPGRPAVFSDAVIQFCRSIKVSFKLPLRQTTGMVANPLQMAGLDLVAPECTTLCRRQKTLAVQIPYRLTLPPTFIRRERDSGSATSDIRAVELTPSGDGDSPVLPETLGQIPKGEEIGAVTADKPYGTRGCHTAVIERQTTAIIPIRKNDRPWKDDCLAAIARNETSRATRHYGRGVWKRWTGYHVRSRIEARMRCLKSLGDRIAARDQGRQTFEVHIRIAPMSRFSAPGAAEIVRVD